MRSAVYITLEVRCTGTDKTRAITRNIWQMLVSGGVDLSCLLVTEARAGGKQHEVSRTDIIMVWACVNTLDRNVWDYST